MSDAIYRDGRADFWRRHFELGLGYADYVAAMKPVRAERWRGMEAALPPLEPGQAARLAPHRRRVNVLFYGGAWCGNCARQGPMLVRLAAAAANAEVRFVEREASEALREELRVMGSLRVPVVVFLSEDFWEIGRCGDRLLLAYRAKAARELGPACETGLAPPPPDELAAEMGEWLDQFERMLLIARLSPPLRERHGD